ncbi:MULTISPECIES: pirin family protein [Pseudomonadaceae]|jgi:redox-sensitive bicupin YhaK (pirin superfamily)|uniref:Pirin-related protein n=1 Tax=Pseudomonas saudiphocaensis TaxID=1499686 RepID=A0A078LSJ0_9PSED|nr:MULTISPECIES: pirin family protein [Pseudomonadaceae]MCF6781853.1 pirin family protein [Stutzerimonas stutzeri]MCF6803897.1 pirin family protein [Stutzerimonas stutzeri]CDZ92811.1 pirin-related protein [Pseudomonas saudiphocaensis]
MIEHRPRSQLGKANHGWLDTHYHFSFADYHDPLRMHWGRLRVWNDDTIAAHSGFPAHPHRDMEIITYVRKGAISHQDSLGNSGRTQAGDVQVMSAGTGITHSEFNLEDEACELFQIWIYPDRSGLPPSWGTRPFPRGERAGAFVTLASGIEGDTDALPIRANARLVAATLSAGQAAQYPIAAGRKVYLVPATGRIEIGDVIASQGDGVAIRDETQLSVKALEDSEVVLVDVL